MGGTNQPGSTRARRSVRLLAPVAAVVVAVIALLVATRPPPTPVPTASSTPSTPVVAATGARVYYEVVAGTGVTLVELALDGRARPREVAHLAGASYGRTFHVDGAGRVALTTLPLPRDDGPGSTRIGLLDLATGGIAPLGEIDATLAGEGGVWSRDGQWWATMAEDDAEARLVVVDLARGAISMIPLDRGLRPIGFASGAELVVAAHDDEGVDRRAPWRFVRVNVANGATAAYPAGALPAVGARSWISSDVAPDVGLEVRHVPADPEQAGSRGHLVLADLRTREERDLGEFDQVWWMAFTPRSDAVVLCTDEAYVLVPLEGEPREVAPHPGEACLDPPMFSPEGTLAAHHDWEGRSVLRLFDLEALRSLEVPVPDGIAEAHFVAVVGERPLPPLLPRPPAPGPPPSDGPAVAGAPAVLAARVAVRVDGRRFAELDVLAPAAEGGVVVTRRMPPIDLAVAGGAQDLAVRAIARPGTDELLLHATWPGASALWRWRPAKAPERLEAPTDWPALSEGLVVAPDGSAVATVGFDAASGAAALFTWELASGDLRRWPMPEGYAMLGRWPVADKIGIGYQVCTEGCPGRYAPNALFDLGSGALAPIADDGTSAGRPLHFASRASAHEIAMSAINEEASDDRSIAWPADLPGLVDVLAVGDDLVVSAGDRIDGLRVYRLADAVARAVARRPPGDPVELGGLPAGMDLRDVSPDGRWARAAGVANGAWLVDLASRASYALGDVLDPPWAAG